MERPCVKEGLLLTLVTRRWGHSGGGETEAVQAGGLCFVHQRGDLTRQFCESFAAASTHLSTSTYSPPTPLFPSLQKRGGMKGGKVNSKKFAYQEMEGGVMQRWKYLQVVGGKEAKELKPCQSEKIALQVY